MAMYEITADQIRKIPETTFSLAGLRERYDLQCLLRSHFDVISPDTLIIARLYANTNKGWLLRGKCTDADRVSREGHWAER